MTRARALLFILLVCGAGILATASPALAAKSQPCWKQVINDWSQDGSIDGAYSAKCIEEALDRVPEDIRAYSDFEEQAKAARLAAGRALQSSGGSGSNNNNPAEGESGSEDEAAPIKPREPDTGPKDETLIQSALGTNGNNADSVPLPLLILLGLAGALITAGALGFGARKLRAHRPPR
ncbi:MAG: hypothetical protein ACJ750_11095 [Gaiellaceae bacterium]